LSNLNYLGLSGNQIKLLPDSVIKLQNLTTLSVESNEIKSIPRWIENLSNLEEIELSGNRLTDLSVLQGLKKLKKVYLFYIELPRRYWIKISDWNPKWLLDEDNAEIR
jgi:leucine-rich repeat protein SHOC2